MSNSALAERLFAGPAMVVDDHIRDSNSNMRPIVNQIRAAHIPVLEYDQLPELQQVRHWRGFSLIVLDWELLPISSPALPAEASESTDPVDPMGKILGLSIPDELGEDVKTDVASFIKDLFTRLYCPIFVFSDQEVDLIWAELVERTEIAKEQLEARILIRSKSDMSAQLFEELGDWLADHPAMYALRSWEEGYENAKNDLFQELQMSALDWPRILWKTSATDDVNQHFELTETITRNILHRFEPLIFDQSILGKASTPGEMDLIALRRVIHRQAVIEGKSLHPDVIMTGDFFHGQLNDAGVPLSIEICLTPACDLVARGIEPKDIELVVVRADLVSDLEQAKKATRIGLPKKETTTSQLVYVFTDTARPYSVNFSTWRRTTWGQMAESRSGRLLDPYLNHLVQKFGLFFQRQGLPRMPDEYLYAPSDEAISKAREQEAERVQAKAEAKAREDAAQEGALAMELGGPEQTQA
jgi:hypothetical protein